MWEEEQAEYDKALAVYMRRLVRWHTIAFSAQDAIADPHDAFLLDASGDVDAAFASLVDKVRESRAMMRATIGMDAIK